MGELIDTTKAAGNNIAGAVKQTVGDLTDDAQLEAEGTAQREKARIQHAEGTIKGELGDEI
jgi:uncharacterized protein YjbJ (UPF0337 family)